jgi:hypothetical protein
MSDSSRFVRRARPAARIAAAVIAAVGLALLAAACGGSSRRHGVAQLGSTATQNNPSTGSGGQSKSGGSPSSQLLAFSRCMRSSGVPSFPDPQAGASNAKFPGAQQLGVGSSQLSAAEAACQHLLPAGSGDQFPAAEVQLLLPGMRNFSRCMRSHGVPNWPDPTVDSEGRPGFNLVPTDIDTGSSQATTATNKCQHLLPQTLGGIPVSQRG